MEIPVAIRTSRSADGPAIEALYQQTFPHEDLVPLVRSLLTNTPGVVSLVADAPDGITGHVAFTHCRVANDPAPVALLGPLAVAPNAQKKGLGSRLVREGLSRLAHGGATTVFVLGDPGYYARFGFAPDLAMAPPYPLVEAYRQGWQSLTLTPSGRAAATGALIVPDAWRHESLWSPQ